MMRVKDFVEALRRGELTQNDIEVEARQYPNVIALVENLWLEDIAEENRHLSEAIDIIRHRVMEPQQLEEYDVFKPRYSVIAQMLNNLQSDGVIEYVKKQIEDYPALLGDGIGFVNYVYKQLSECADLNIYGRGSKLLDRDEAGNIFEQLKQLEYDLSKIDKNRCVEPQRENKNNVEVDERPFPSELACKEARKYFDKARELGLIDGDYKWLRSKQLLSCFARDMSYKLELGKGLNADGTSRISWKPFEILFKQSNLRLSYNDILKTGQLPIGYKLLDDVFIDK